MFKGPFLSKYCLKSTKIKENIFFHIILFSFYQKIYSGSDTTAPLVKDLCGQVHPPPIVSTGNVLTVSVIQENLIQRSTKFTAFYSTMQNSKLSFR